MTSTILLGTHMMPQCFFSIEEARIHIGSIQHRLLCLLNSDSGGDILSYITSHRTLNTIPSSYLVEREGLLNNFIQWHIAFDPILQRVRCMKDDKDVRAALILHLQYMTTYFHGLIATQQDPITEVRVHAAICGNDIIFTIYPSIPRHSDKYLHFQFSDHQSTLHLCLSMSQQRFEAAGNLDGTIGTKARRFLGCGVVVEIGAVD